MRSSGSTTALCAALSVFIAASPAWAVVTKAGVSARARGNLVGLFSDNDYPRVALTRGEQGMVAVRLLVSPTGRVSSCTVVTSASASLDARTCAVLTARASFVPARTKAGRPTTDTFHQRVMWRIPEPEPDEFEPVAPPLALLDQTVERVIVVRSGTVDSCRSVFTPNLADPDGAEAQVPCAEAAALTPRLLASAPASLGQSYRIITILRRIVGPSGYPAGMIDSRLEAHFIRRMTIDANGSVHACDLVSRDGIKYPASLSSCDAELVRYTPLKPEDGSNDRHVTIVETIRYEEAGP